MKAMWETPRVAVEAFAPNDYVAVCWNVKCDDVASDTWEQTHKTTYNNKTYYWSQINTWDKGPGSVTGDNHSPDHCGSADNQFIVDSDNNGIADGMIEKNTAGLGNLNCTFYDDDTFTNQINIWDVQLDNGNPIYWTTSSQLTNGPLRIWHHIGTIIGIVTGHINRS